jgi:mono/diheme cytochrome c family protein
MHAPHPSTPLQCRWHRRTCAVVLAVLAATACARRGAVALPQSAPARLADTGLYADAASRTVAPELLPFAPQYPLWTDGAAKERWIALPPGTAIDASDPDDWQFPIGTRLWKVFTFPTGVETRFMLRRDDGTWLYASYVRTPDGSDDVLAPEAGVRGVCATEGGKRHDVPSLADCRLCHENGRTPVLGFSALQLSTDRDPLAPHTTLPPAGAVDLASLAARGLVRGLPGAVLVSPPRIAARSDTERAALGWLHGNCSSCHNATGPLQRLGLRLDHPLGEPHDVPPAIATTLGVPSAFTRGDARQRIAPGAPERSALFVRVAADDALAQMPPFGRHLVDHDATALLDRWIRTDLAGGAPAAPLVHSTTNPKEKERQ